MFIVLFLEFFILAIGLDHVYGLNFMQAVIGSLVLLLAPILAISYFLKDAISVHGVNNVFGGYAALVLLAACIGIFIAPNTFGTFPRSSVPSLNAFGLFIGFAGPFMAAVLILLKRVEADYSAPPPKMPRPEDWAPSPRSGVKAEETGATKFDPSRFKR